MRECHFSNLFKLVILQEEAGRLIQKQRLGVLVEVAGDELKDVVLVRLKGQVDGLADISGLLVKNDGFVKLRLLASLEVLGRFQLLVGRGQHGHVPQLLTEAVLFADPIESNKLRIV